MDVTVNVLPEHSIVMIDIVYLTNEHFIQQQMNIHNYLHNVVHWCC